MSCQSWILLQVVLHELIDLVLNAEIVEEEELPPGPSSMSHLPIASILSVVLHVVLLEAPDDHVLGTMSCLNGLSNPANALVWRRMLHTESAGSMSHQHDESI